MTCKECNGDGVIKYGDIALWCNDCNGAGLQIAPSVELVPAYFDRFPSEALTAADVRSAKLDRCPWNGAVHDELKVAVLVQVMRSIRDEQPGASSTVKALAAAALDVTGLGNQSKSNSSTV